MATDIEASIRLALAMRAQPGAYAVLLASGASRSAGIPTGWEILQDLCRQVAELRGSDPGLDPTAWFAQEFGRPAAYDMLLDELTGTGAERAGLLKPFFEPTPEEIEQGLKVPTAAHHAVAQLVQQGSVRLILTLNFDRLMEQALDAAAMPYVVASTPEAMAGMNPLHLQRCVVIKLHGDYLDPGLLNTPAELDSYDTRTDALLDQVLDEYGLVAVGWSATWDKALRRAVQRCPNRRFSWFWVSPGALSNEAKELIALRQAEVVNTTADTFMTDVAEAVASLVEGQRADPRNVSVAVATAKRSLGASERPVRLHDMLRDEFRLVDASTPVSREVFEGGVSLDAYVADVEQLESLAQCLVSLTAVAAFWGNAGTDRWWVDRVAAYANDLGRRPQGGSTALINLLRYPSTLLGYAGGVAAVAAQRYETLAALDDVRAIDRTKGVRLPWFNVVTPSRVLGGFFNSSGRTGQEVNDDPVGHVKRVVGRVLIDHVLVSPDEYEDAHDLFVYLLTLAAMDRASQAAAKGDENAWHLEPPRDFHGLRSTGGWGNPRLRVSEVVLERAQQWGATGGGPLAVGMFGGDIDRLLSAHALLDRAFIDSHRG